jgi:hypothetical protein
MRFEEIELKGRNSVRYGSEKGRNVCLGLILLKAGSVWPPGHDMWRAVVSGAAALVRRGSTPSVGGRWPGWDGMTGLPGLTRVELALFLNPVRLRDR